MSTLGRLGTKKLNEEKDLMEDIVTVLRVGDKVDLQK